MHTIVLSLHNKRYSLLESLSSLLCHSLTHNSTFHTFRVAILHFHSDSQSIYHNYSTHDNYSIVSPLYLHTTVISIVHFYLAHLFPSLSCILSSPQKLSVLCLCGATFHWPCSVLRVHTHTTPPCAPVRQLSLGPLSHHHHGAVVLTSPVQKYWPGVLCTQ